MKVTITKSQSTLAQAKGLFPEARRAQMAAKYYFLIVLAIIMSCAGALPQVFAQSSPPRFPKSNYQLTIDGTATMVGKWLCGGDANISAVPSPATQTVPGLEAGIQLVTVTASIPDIDCGDSVMNKHLRKALKDKEFPEVKYQATKYTLVDNGEAVQTSGELTIAGITKQVGLGAKLIPLPEGGTRVVGQVEINMLDFGVKPPSVFFGALRVAKNVTVRFDTVVRLPREMTQALFPKLQTN
jgi:polyisoprenoid-binding protein YceI